MVRKTDDLAAKAMQQKQAIATGRRLTRRIEQHAGRRRKPGREERTHTYQTFLLACREDVVKAATV